MSIEIQQSTQPITGASLTSSGKGNVLGITYDAGMTKIYAIIQDSVTASQINWKVIDLANPLVPVISNWTPISMAFPSYFGSLLNTTNKNQNCLALDPSDATVVALFIDPSAGGTHLKAAKIDLGTGGVTYLNTSLAFNDTSSVFFTEVRGVKISTNSIVAMVGGTVSGVTGMYLVHWDTTGFNFLSSSVPSNATILAANSETLVTQVGAVHPDAMLAGPDGSWLTFFGDTTKCIKYTLDSGSTPGFYFEGISDFGGSADLGSMFTAAGYFLGTNRAFSTTSTTLMVKQWLDRSTGVISHTKSAFTLPDRIIQIGESTAAVLTLQLKDGFGKVITGLSGQLCRFTIVTSRGIIDNDDASLAASSSGPFSDGNGTPLNRQVDVPFDSSSIATAYFQSARTSIAQSVIDTVRVIYPLG